MTQNDADQTAAAPAEADAAPLTGDASAMAPADAPVAHIALSDEDFRHELAAVIPHLRAFGRSLCGNRDLADDLVQDTLGKAWAARQRFQAGTNMRAWTFIILRNIFLSQMRRARFHGDYDEEAVERTHSAPASQDQSMELADVQRALLRLPQAQREALVLVGAGGFAYEEAAAICNVAVGTIKSRVARGRMALEAILTNDLLPTRRSTDAGGAAAMAAILAEVDTLSGDHSAAGYPASDEPDQGDGLEDGGGSPPPASRR